MTEEHVEIRGAEIVYERAGEGPDLIWGHGLSQHRVAEDALRLIDFTQITANIVRYDARGHGASETTPNLGDYSWAAMARDQLALADHLGIDRFIAAGASMGCGTALHVAVQAPERVERLALMIPPTAWETRADQTDQYELMAQVIEARGVEPVIAARADMAPPDPFVGDAHRLEVQAAALRAWDPARLAQVMRGATTADLPDRDQIRAIGVPTLVLAWSGDPGHPVSTAEELVHLLPDARLYVASTPESLATWTSLMAEWISDSPASHR